MKHWALLLHFYQPPTQTSDVLLRVANESYRPLIAVLRRHKNARLAVNIQGVLTELLRDHGLDDVLTGLAELAEEGQVEFVGSGKFHPILPLIPEELRRTSIEQNAATNREAFGRAWAPRGFFPPEMCFGPEITPSIAESGHEWFVASGVACPVHWPTKVVHRVAGGSRQLAVLFRDDIRSNRISFRETTAQGFIEELDESGRDGDSYVLTAMDAETFGHHIVSWEEEFLGAAVGLLAEQGERERVRMVLPSDLLRLYPAGEVIEPRRSSWSTSDDELLAGDPYPLWKSPGNHVHAWQWEYAEHCIALVADALRLAGTREAKKRARRASEALQPALHSCQFWWASRRPMWDVSMIARGLNLLTAVRLDAMHAIVAGGADGQESQSARWRNARAAELRNHIERELIETSAP